MTEFPTEPQTPPVFTATTRTAVRFEDLAQDGRLLVETFATFVNEALWNVALAGHPIDTHAFQRGELAILTRFVVETSAGPFPVEQAFEVEARGYLAHEPSPDGSVERIYLNAWVDAYGTLGRTNGLPCAHAGTRARLGRAFAEHVFTRPFAPKASRKVTSLDVPGIPAVPQGVYHRAGADAPFGQHGMPDAVDATAVVFGMRHTDGNQHVNSLVYPRLVEEAAARALHPSGRAGVLMADRLDVHYQRPRFAGDRVALALRLTDEGDDVWVDGAFVDEADVVEGRVAAGARPSTRVRLRLSPQRS